MIRALWETVEQGRGAVLALVVGTQGSVPRKAGAKMLVHPDGTIQGTIGGGRLERRIIEEALRLLKGEGGARLLAFDLEKDLDMACGGSTKIYLEALSRMRRLVLFGGGHIGHALYTLWPLLGMTPVVVDERPEFCNETRFPAADLHPVLPGEAVERLGLGERDHVVIATHRHLRDLECLRRVIEHPVGYVGMIGSRKKAAATLDGLHSEGVAKDRLQRVHTPIGLNLGGRSPGEIAVAIAAEIIAVGHGGRTHAFDW